MVLGVIYPWPHESDMLPDNWNRDGSLVLGNRFQDKQGVRVVRVLYRKQLCILEIETDIDPLVTTLLETNGFYDPARHFAL